MSIEAKIEVFVVLLKCAGSDSAAGNNLLGLCDQKSRAWGSNRNWIADDAPPIIAFKVAFPSEELRTLVLQS